MLEAKDRGQKVPDDVLKLSLAYAQTVAADTIETMDYFFTDADTAFHFKMRWR